MSKKNLFVRKLQNATPQAIVLGVGQVDPQMSWDGSSDLDVALSLHMRFHLFYPLVLLFICSSFIYMQFRLQFRLDLLFICSFVCFLLGMDQVLFICSVLTYFLTFYISSIVLLLICLFLFGMCQKKEKKENV